MEEGAYFYVCGDAKRMAKGVDAALHRVIETAGGVDAQARHGFRETTENRKALLARRLLTMPAPSSRNRRPSVERRTEDISRRLLRRGATACRCVRRLVSGHAGCGPGRTWEEETPLIAEERIKREEHPLDSYYRITENALSDKAPEKEEIFRFKWNGLFYLSPVKDAFMARLRIPGGQLKTFQLREIASVARELTTGYVQITTRANLQIRLIKPKDTPEVLRRIQSVGLHTRGAGADNIRNLTSNPTAGIDPAELIDCTPFVNDLGQFILSQREFYDLPRKFNIAFDGGGLIGSVEDTNDIGIKAVKHGDSVGFRIALGGATGHKAFARDIGVLVAPSDIVKVVIALLRVFISNGNRGDRKRARLKHLLETWTLDKYLAETEKVLGREIPRAPLQAGEIVYPAESLPHSHIGAYPQKQRGLYYLGIALPAGQITPKQNAPARRTRGQLRLR